MSKYSERREGRGRRVAAVLACLPGVVLLPWLGCGSGSVQGVGGGGGSGEGGSQAGAVNTGGTTNAGGAGASVGGASGAGDATGGSTVGSGGAPTVDASTGGTATGGASAGTGGRPGAGGGTGTGGRVGTDSSTGGGVVIDSGSLSPDSGRDAVGTCARWKADRADLSEGTWTGNVAACDPGTITEPGKTNALRLFNLYRWLADLPPVVNAPNLDTEAQACALMMDANNMLSHTPPTTWLCYTALGAMGAMTSNISGGPGVSSVDLYLIDTGNETTFGHRRIVLSNELGPIGLGSTGTGGASCMQNIGGTGKAGKTWLAWPPPGVFPLQAYQPQTRGRSLSDTGWSFQTVRTIVLTGAQVTITSGGTNMPVTVTQSTGTYGNTNAISILPMGWTVAAGQTYSVSITGITPPVSYDVQIVNCN